MFSLNREQRETIALLFFGTFLEFFDSTLYIHMSMLLNELFFPKTDPYTSSLLGAFAFCSTFILRPIGVLLFRWLGDNIGRKSTVIITTFMMAVSCVIIASLPTYEQIGIIAAWFVTICRIVQGLSSLGEIIGAELYLIEIIPIPLRYPTVSLLKASYVLGSLATLAVASFSISYGFNWRIAFWIGAFIAVIGSIARTRLRETPDFIDAKRKVQRVLKESGYDPGIIETTHPMMQQVKLKTSLSLFFMNCMQPFCFYFTYMYCGVILKNSFNYSAEQIIYHNLIISILHLTQVLIITYLSYIIYPLRIIKILLIIFSIFIVLCPYLLNNVKTPFDLLLIQTFIVFFSVGTNPAKPIFYKYFPIFKRFTYISILHSIAIILMFLSTSFGLIYLIEYFGYWGILVIVVPSIIAFTFGLLHFEKMEKESSHLLRSLY